MILFLILKLLFLMLDFHFKKLLLFGDLNPNNFIILATNHLFVIVTDGLTSIALNSKTLLFKVHKIDNIFFLCIKPISLAFQNLLLGLLSLNLGNELLWSFNFGIFSFKSLIMDVLFFGYELIISSLNMIKKRIMNWRFQLL